MTAKGIQQHVFLYAQLLRVLKEKDFPQRENSALRFEMLLIEDVQDNHSFVLMT